MPDEHQPPSLDGWTPLRSHLANIEDALRQLTYVTAHADPASASPSPRPEYPHMVRRKEIQRSKDTALLAILVPWDV